MVRLALNLHKDDVHRYDEIDSIDEASEIYVKHLLGNNVVQGPAAIPDMDQDYLIPPRQEFWGHCSNLQVWAERGYDIRLLHSNLAFPLLEKLTDVGDPQAQRIFKEEIAKRIESGYSSVLTYLIQEGYTKYLLKDEIDPLLQNVKDGPLKYLLENYTNFQHCQLDINSEGYLITVDNMLGVNRLIDDKYEDSHHSHSISLATERDSLKKVKFKDEVSYDFHVITQADHDEITEKVKVVLPYKYLWWGHRILHKRSDCRLYIPQYPLSKKIITHHLRAHNQIRRFPLLYILVSKSEGYVVSIAPRLIYSGALERSLDYRRNRRRARLKNKKDYSLTFKLKGIYKEIKNKKKCSECLYFTGDTCNCIFGKMSTFETMITLAIECSYSDYFRDIILLYKKKGMKVEKSMEDKGQIPLKE